MREDLDAIIEPIIEAARIPSRRRRDELRRELRGHFEDVGQAPEAVDDAVARFGDSARIGNSFRHVYQRDYMLLYVVKVVACIAAAITAAIVIEAIAGLRLDRDADAWHLSPGFAHAAPFGVVLALALVAAAEATGAPFMRSRAIWSLGGYALVSACAFLVNPNSGGAFVTAGILATIGVAIARAATAWTLRASLTLVAFTVVEYLLHKSLGIMFGPVRALATSAILLTLWASTITIVAFSDRTFVSAFTTT
jgi:hypothetical protein